jgi:hypothetical protein
MPRRRRPHGVIAVLALSGVGLGCQADLGTAGCIITQQATLAASPLTLLPDARLDAVGSGYVLIGSDGAAVRWASLTPTQDGLMMGMEHAFGLPSNISSPALFAVASSSSTSLGDTVLVGWLAPDATGTKGDLSMIAVPADGSPPMGPATVVHEFPNGVPDPATVAMVSSRKGMNAGLAWEDPTLGQVLLAAVDYTGALVGQPTPTAPVAPPLDCLSFQSGKDDLTLVYHGKLTSTAGSGWVIAEANEGGGVDSYTTFAYSGQYTANCIRMAPTSTGYALAWQDSTGGSLTVLVAGSNTMPVVSPFAPSNGFGGADLQPPIVALAPFQQDFGVLFQKAYDAELWQVDPAGNRRSGALIFPSAQGNMGAVSTVLETKGGMLVPGGALVATYADYPAPLSSSDGGTPTTGNRVFLNATCH